MFYIKNYIKGKHIRGFSLIFKTFSISIMIRHQYQCWVWARVPERCHASGAAVDVCSDAPAEAQRAERTAEGVLETFHAPSLGRHVHRE